MASPRNALSHLNSGGFSLSGTLVILNVVKDLGCERGCLFCGGQILRPCLKMTRHIARTSMYYLVIFIVMCVGLLSSSCLAVEFAGGTGEAADPYLIATAEQLLGIGNDSELLSKYFRLTDDIDLDPNLPGGQVFALAVIASTEDPYNARRPKFTGRFYGDGHTVRHLTIDSNDGEYLGLFGYIGSGGRVYDLNLEAVDIRGHARLGALAGYSEGSMVNCSASGRVAGNDYSRWLGGLIGINAGTLSGCHAEIAVAGGDSSSMLGGLAGWHEGRILNCTTSGSISGGDDAFQLGGLVGRSLAGMIEDSTAGTSVFGGARSWALGGLVGRADSGSFLLRCTATGAVTAEQASHDLAGLAGQHWYGTMLYCHATGPVAAGQGGHTLGGLVGACAGGRIVAGYATGPVSGQAGSRLLGGLIGQLQTAGVVTDCYATGRLLVDDEPYGRGGLVGRVAGPQDARIERCFWDTETSGTTVSGAGIGLTTAQMQNAQTYLAAGWDLTGSRAEGTADVWRLPEGGGYPVLTDVSEPNVVPVLEGAGRSFDPYLIATAEDLGAMVHYDRFAWFELAADIDLSGIVWTNAPVPIFAGVFDGRGHRITNLTVHGDGTAPAGLFGRVAEGAWVFDLGLDDVAIEGVDGATDLGGLVGTNAGTIINCYVTGRVSTGATGRSLGGLVGSNRQGTIGDCYATATVTGGPGSRQLGGLIGYNFLGTVVTCYAAGAVSGTDVTRAGGLVGHNVDHALIADCTYLSRDNLNAEAVWGTPLTDGQMKQQTSFPDWDFAKTWVICEGQTYPHLQWERIPCEP